MDGELSPHQRAVREAARAPDHDAASREGRRSIGAMTAPAPWPFELVSRHCPVCGATESRPFAPANVDPTALGTFAFAARKLPEYMHFALVTCPSCDLLYTNPAPAPGALEALYPEASFDAPEDARLVSVTYGRQIERTAGR